MNPLPTRLRAFAPALLLALLAPAHAVAPPPDEGKALVAAGHNRFDKLCVSCHGTGGAGVAPGGANASYGPKLAARSDLPEERIRDRIIHGKHGDKAMPPWGTVLEAKEIDQLVAYVKRLASTPAGQGTGPLAPFDLNEQARIDAGKRRFAKTCAGYCHGFEGVGGRAPDFKGRTDLPAEVAYETISKGRQGADVMPPWGGAFSEEQIWELVAYLQYLGKQQP
ncbi:c-type cytochrome [Zoogloea sp. LCSB751]|uniref:c-type cytochrome n=1 Tax=Zoogloea sp. LCSB751 TaxID=1965277 RepID=UPI000B496A9D|nr:c-type cytochrome [Zoogloea sp. LCSB751]